MTGSKSPTTDPGPASPGCPDDATLERALDLGGPEADDASLQAVAAHLEQCAACQARLVAMAGGDKATAFVAKALATPELAKPASDPALLAAMADLRRDGVSAASLAGGRDDDDAEDDAPSAPDLSFLKPATTPGCIGRFGEYEVIQVLGHGGMGVVLKARDPSLDRVVAIKVLAPQLAASPVARRRFLREARAAAAVSHEHVVTIHAVDEADGMPFLVMQFVAGRSLSERISAGGPLRLEEILRIGMQAASGLAAAHAQGLVHRDVKPANIMLENGVERVKLTDFGLARAADDIAVTATGTVAGTPAYMAPEQARGERVDHRADLFSLGAVMYAMCTGLPPFVAASAVGTLRKVCDEEPKPIRQINEDIPGWLVEIINRLMRKNAVDRPASALAVASELSEHLARIQIAGPRTRDAVAAAEAAPKPLRPRSRLTPALAVVAILAFGVMLGGRWLGFFPAPERPQEPPAIAKRDPNAHIEPAKATSPLSLPSTRPSTNPSSSSQPALKNPFVLLAKSGERAFETLAAATEAAQPGDTIEIRHTGPLLSPPVRLGRKPLALRAAPGCWPILQPKAADDSLLTTEAALSVEGIEFNGFAETDTFSGAGGKALVSVSGGSFAAANCRFIIRTAGEGRMTSLQLHETPEADLRNCEAYGRNCPPLVWSMAPADAKLRLTNSIIAGRCIVVIRRPKAVPGSIHFNNCSLLSGTFMVVTENDHLEGLTINTTLSAVGTFTMLSEVYNRDHVSDAKRLNAVNWNDDRTIYFLGRTGEEIPSIQAGRQIGNRRGAIDATFRFSGDVGPKSTRTDAPVPSEFTIINLRPNGSQTLPPKLRSELGARISNVGPGQPYDAFRETGQYLLWRSQARDIIDAKD